MFFLPGRRRTKLKRQRGVTQSNVPGWGELPGDRSRGISGPEDREPAAGGTGGTG